jgi:hypothetical protein
MPWAPHSASGLQKMGRRDPLNRVPLLPASKWQASKRCSLTCSSLCRPGRPLAGKRRGRIRLRSVRLQLHCNPPGRNSSYSDRVMQVFHATLPARYADSPSWKVAGPADGTGLSGPGSGERGATGYAMLSRRDPVETQYDDWNATIYCVLVVRATVMVSCAEPWFSNGCGRRKIWRGTMRVTEPLQRRARRSRGT